MSAILSKTLAVLKKDLKSEYKTRHSMAAVLLFIVATITIIVFGTAGEILSGGMTSGFIWIIYFFIAMTSLARSFVGEEERGTSLLLKLSVSPGPVYFGKLIYNIILSLLLNTVAVILFFILSQAAPIENIPTFIITHVLGSIGIASGTTVISAIISKAGSRGALFPVLSLPIILPIVMIGIAATKTAFTEKNMPTDDFLLMAAYSGILIPVSYILFDQVWND
jgi:heme exporter protein B